MLIATGYMTHEAMATAPRTRIRLALCALAKGRIDPNHGDILLKKFMHAFGLSKAAELDILPLLREEMEDISLCGKDGGRGGGVGGKDTWLP